MNSFALFELILLGMDIGIILVSCSPLARIFSLIGAILLIIDLHIKGIL
jgi:hypothetical protein